MSIPRGTTPTFTLTFTEQGLDLTTAENVYVTFEQFGKTLTKTGESLTVSAKQIEVYLSQAETLAFSTGDIEIQANWTTAAGGRTASEVTTYTLTKQLLDEVIE